MSPDPLFSEQTEPEREVLTVRQVNEEISAAIERSFPRTVWVRGEVQRLPSDAARRTHVYFELHETGGSGAAEYQISTSLMGWDRQRFDLGRYLDGHASRSGNAALSGLPDFGACLFAETEVSEGDRPGCVVLVEEKDQAFAAFP